MAFARRMMQHGGDRMQIGPWRSSGTVANLVPFPTGEAVAVEAVSAAVEQAARQGYSSAYTAALTQAQALPFLRAGFEVAEELHLLSCALSAGGRPVRGRTRRGRRTDWPEVLELDALAFDDFWKFDRVGLTDAIRATPRHRFQVTRTAPVLGYHITGLAGTNSYVQRLAVHPEAQGRGWGMALVTDALEWSAHHGARTAHVNTQLHNHRAVALYEKCGFELAPQRLQVLQLDFADHRVMP